MQSTVGTAEFGQRVLYVLWYNKQLNHHMNPRNCTICQKQVLWIIALLSFPGCKQFFALFVAVYRWRHYLFPLVMIENSWTPSHAQPPSLPTTLRWKPQCPGSCWACRCPIFPLKWHQLLLQWSSPSYSTVSCPEQRWTSICWFINWPVGGY